MAPTSVAAEAFPVTAKVSQISAGDPLNVRTEPSAKSADIGDLALDALVEVLQRSADGAWAQILWGERNAWVSNRYLREMPRPRLYTGLPVAMRCGGNEPSWSVTLSQSGDFQLDTLAGDKARAPIAWSGPSLNEGDSAYAFGTQNYTGVIRREICTDGASDAVYGWRMDLVSGEDNNLFSGCCTLSK